MNGQANAAATNTQHLAGLKDSQTETADALILCREEQLPCHSLLLSVASPVLAELCDTSPRKENGMLIIALDKDEAVAKKFLEWLYSAHRRPSCVMDSHTAVQLAFLSHEWAIPALAEICDKVLMEQMKTRLHFTEPANPEETDWSSSDSEGGSYHPQPYSPRDWSQGRTRSAVTHVLDWAVFAGKIGLPGLEGSCKAYLLAIWNQCSVYRALKEMRHEVNADFFLDLLMTVYDRPTVFSRSHQSTAEISQSSLA